MLHTLFSCLQTKGWMFDNWPLKMENLILCWIKVLSSWLQSIGFLHSRGCNRWMSRCIVNKVEERIMWMWYLTWPVYRGSLKFNIFKPVSSPYASRHYTSFDSNSPYFLAIRAGMFDSLMVIIFFLCIIFPNWWGSVRICADSTVPWFLLRNVFLVGQMISWHVHSSNHVMQLIASRLTTCNRK